MRVNMHEAKTNLSRLVASVESGEVSEIQIARAGTVVARLVAPRTDERRPGCWRGQVHIHDDFDELPADVAEAFDGNAP